MTADEIFDAIESVEETGESAFGKHGATLQACADDLCDALGAKSALPSLACEPPDEEFGLLSVYLVNGTEAEARPVVLQIAKRHRLACHDCQTSEVFYADGTKQAGE
jgi:hypothetical protein